MKVSYEEILKKAESYQADMTKFLRDMVKIPSESCDEKKVVLRIKEEMEKLGIENSDFVKKWVKHLFLPVDRSP